MNLNTIYTACLLSLFLACGTLQETMKSMEDMSSSSESTVPSTTEMASGLKEALIKGTEMGVDQLHQSGGFLNDAEVKIPFPEDLDKVKNTLIDMGLSSQVNKAVQSMNAAAEDAVIEAKPLFVNAIREMTIDDAKGILFGNDTAATTYLRGKTSAGLQAAFKPKIQTSLDKVNATKYWGDVIGTYNKIPLVTKVNEDLAGYVTDLAINGLFNQIAEEEAAIRDNPLERTSNLLKKVFGYADGE